jgi:phage terminase large subunit-like protein
MTEPTAQELKFELDLLTALEEHKRFNQLEYFKPYPKQKLFLDLGATKLERLFMAGNRVGKTETGGFEVACHLTGLYPEWWAGKRFDHPVEAWGVGCTSLDTRNIIQEKLCGKHGMPSLQGTRMIPKDRILRTTLARGVSDAFDTVQVQHSTDGVNDGISTIAFKSYEQGREKFQGTALHVGWCDEMPSLNQLDVYAEFGTRLQGTGIMIITATPLLNTLVDLFTKDITPYRAMVQMTMDEAEHLTPEAIEAMYAGFPVHERETRRLGVPMAGFGRVFPYDEQGLKEPYLEYIPPAWPKLWGIDFGINHPFAAVLIAWDKDNDVIHVLHTIRVKDQQALQHAAAMKTYAAAVPVAWPQDGTAREHGSGATLASTYRACGLRMLAAHATFPDGGYSTEAGYQEIADRITTGRIKVAAHLSDFFEEFRNLHRDKNGIIVKVNDDIMSALRTAVMMRRYAGPAQLGSKFSRNRQTIARDLDFDLS